MVSVDKVFSIFIANTKGRRINPDCGKYGRDGAYIRFWTGFNGPPKPGRENGNNKMPRPDRPIEGRTPRSKTGCGYLYVVDNTADEYKEVFFRLGKPGGCPAAFLQALSMVVSLALRAGVEKKRIVELFKEISCPNPCWDGPKHNLSCPDAIARMLESEIE